MWNDSAPIGWNGSYLLIILQERRENGERRTEHGVPFQTDMMIIHNDLYRLVLFCLRKIWSRRLDIIHVMS